jgi:hypothetical protein
VFVDDRTASSKRLSENNFFVAAKMADFLDLSLAMVAGDSESTAIICAS